jgi:hypothetical protein
MQGGVRFGAPSEEQFGEANFPFVNAIRNIQSMSFLLMIAGLLSGMAMTIYEREICFGKGSASIQL